MDFAEFILIIVNLLTGFGFAIPIAKLLSKVNEKPTRIFRHFAILIGIYFVECVVLVMGMGIPVFSVRLAFIWGIVFGLWLRFRASTGEVLRVSLFLSLYSCLPATSFILIPVLAGLGGRNILSAEEGFRFGIPDFLHLPWPLNTILGFYAVLVIGAVVLKTIITLGEVSLLIHFGKKPEAGGFLSSVKT
jgi:hypothetical protein